MLSPWLVVVYALAACTLCGLLVGSRREAGNAGAALGFFFGPIGVLAAFALDNRPRCNTCRERIDREAAICPHCATRFIG